MKNFLMSLLLVIAVIMTALIYLGTHDVKTSEVPVKEVEEEEEDEFFGDADKEDTVELEGEQAGNTQDGE